MKSLYRVLMSLLLMLATVFLVNCAGGAPGCPQVLFGSSTCLSGSGGGTGFGGGGTGGGGGGSSSTTLYAYDIDQAGTIDGYTNSSSAGQMVAITNYTAPTIPVNAGGVGMVVAQKQYLYAGFGSTGQLYGWVIASDGSLTAISGSPYTAPFLGFYGSGVGETDMTTDPGGTLLFISDTLQNEIYVYQIGTNGVLTAAANSPFAVPFEPMNLATDGLGKYLYAIDGNYTTHQGSEIAAYSIGSGGVLTPVVGSPFSGTGYNMWFVKGDPTGNFLIGTTGSWAFDGVPDDDHLYVFNITQTGTNAGAITPVTTSPFSTVYSPFGIAVQSDTGGNLVYSVSINDTATGYNPVEGYSLSTSGTLTAVTGSPFTGVGNGQWAQFDQSGAFLFVYQSYENTAGQTITQLVPLSVASGGTLTQPLSNLTLATPGFWVVTDEP
jgi:6-phosphogluconolactonase